MKKLYIVYVHITPDGMHYYGVTSNIKRRWECNGIRYKRTSLQPYIEQYGWDNIKHIVLFRDKSKEDALKIENFLIETAQEDGVCINQRRSGLVSKEEGYQREYQREYHREYREQNREKIREKNREYNRRYRQRKKLEKQLKEVEDTPLF